MTSPLLGKIRKYSLGLLTAVLAAALLMMGLVAVLLYTETGSRRATELILARANQAESFHMSVASISGNLFQGLQLDAVDITTATAILSLDSLSATWNPYSLLSGGLYLEALSLDQIDIELVENSNTSSTAIDESSLIELMTAPEIPFAISIGAFQITEISVSGNGIELLINQAKLSASLSDSILHVEEFELSTNDYSLAAELEAVLSNNIPLVADISWEYRGSLPWEYQGASGRASLRGDLQDLSIEHELSTPQQIFSSGRLLSPLDSTSRTADFSHNASRFPLLLAQAQNYDLVNTVLQTQYSAEQLELALSTQLENADLPSITVTGLGILQNEELQLQQFQISTDSGSVAGAGVINFANDLVGRVDFTLREQDPLRYVQSTLPTSLTNIAGNGSVTLENNGQPSIRLALESLSGNISDYEVLGSAAVTVENQRIEIGSLQLNTIDNSLSASGIIDDELSINWQIEAPAINQLLLDYSGSVSAIGTLLGPLDNPRVSADLRASELEIEGISFGEAVTELNGAMDALTGVATLSAINFIAGDELQEIDWVKIELEGGPEQHRVSASVNSAYGGLEIALQGSIVTDVETSWQGSLNTASVNSSFGNWVKTSTATAVEISSSLVRIDSSCWLAGDTEACLTLNRVGSEGFEFTAALSGLPLQEFNSGSSSSRLFEYEDLPRLPPELSLAGSVNARASGTLGDGMPSIQFTLAAEDTLLTIEAPTNSETEGISEEDETQHQYAWRTLTVDGSLNNNIWRLNNSAVLAQENLEDSGLALNGRIDSSLVYDSAGDLSGRVSATFEDLSWVQAFLPDISAITGQLNSELTVAGNLTAPVVTGEVVLRQAAFSVPLLGIALHEIDTTFRAQEDGYLSLTGALGSGEGALAIEGDITDFYTPARELKLTLNGEGLQLANLPDLVLKVSPEITITANQQTIDVQGDLHLAQLDMTMTELPESAIDVSRDAVVVNYPADRPELARSIAGDQSTLFDIPVTANIDLSLGEEVSVNGFGMQASLGGNLAVQQQADGRNTTYGELNVISGSYTIYGQSLELRQGKLLFFGAVDNPALDIRAVREVDNMTAGVLINGTLKNMRSELFSTPALPENDIISVLVTGRPFSELDEQGGTAVLGAIAKLGLGRSGGNGLTTQIRNRLGLDALSVNSTGGINASVLTVGKYLTPKIFIRYGVGLFDRQSKVAIDYTLSERLKLEAESGEYQSVDITYTVER